MSRRAIRSGLALGMTVAFAGCIFPPEVGSGSGGGGGGGTRGPHAPSSGGEGGTSSLEGGSADAAAVGTTCDVPTTAGPMLCEGISKCKGVTVNQNSWMGCGFVAAGKGFTLACECTGYLCAASPTPTCAAAALILEQQTGMQVCAQLGNGGCNPEFFPDGSIADSGSGTAKCDPSCTSECAGDPSCLAGCGC